MHTHKKLNNGFEYIEINNSSASAKIALNGAHIFHYEQKGKKPLLWLSENSNFEHKKAIRGGIPICWPWFGTSIKQTQPQHGFARTSLFELTNINELDSNTTELSFKLEDSYETRKLWDYKFLLEFTVTISDKLTMKLKTTNNDSKEFKITQALHSYFLVSDISDVSIKGLDKRPYLDALSMENKVQNSEITFNEEVDRVYQEVDKTIIIQDKNRFIIIQNEGSSSAVVWNPWIDKCSRMSGMKDDAYKSFVCIESANAFDDFKIIKPKQTHILKATLF